ASSVECRVMRQHLAANLDPSHGAAQYRRRMGATDTAVTELMTATGHEQLVFVADAPPGLRAVIAVHSTALGPSLGGIRFWRYPSERDAVLDALRLSE